MFKKKVLLALGMAAVLSTGVDANFRWQCKDLVACL